MTIEKTEPCKYCCGDNDLPECCLAVSENSFMCTRKLGHEGPHVACGGMRDHEIETWEDEVADADSD